MQFTNDLYASLPDIANRPDIFGDQIIMDDTDHAVGVLDKLLLQAAPYSIDDLAAMAKRADGCAVPAHINRDSFSILSNLGFIPDGLFSAVEVAASLPCPQIDRKYHKLSSSGAA